MPTKGLSPVQRTLRALRQQGYISCIVEKFIPYGKFPRRVDAFNFIDILAIKPKGICGIQACGSNFKEHDRKILSNEYALEWLKAGGCIELYAWRKIKKKRGGKQLIWKPRIKEYLLEDFE